ncbi:GM17476 [Drosophila sechellia]|uniref:GM17476 n=1 Tax=Drosophila sechellia TaxID=7238 RepID=B4IHK3_DROSE|nr:GM17476 [Drosophila sechellia]
MAEAQIGQRNGQQQLPNVTADLGGGGPVEMDRCKASQAKPAKPAESTPAKPTQSDPKRTIDDLP